MAKNRNRDEFTPATKRLLERQAGCHCSNPTCRHLTSGATSDGKSLIRVGEAAHIRAAAPGGSRYDGDMTREERRSADNGIWLCEICASFVDSEDPKFTVQLLQDWKQRTIADTWRSVTHRVPYGSGSEASTPDELRTKFRAAAHEDLGVFRRTAKWPTASVELTLKIDALDEPLSTRALAAAVTTFTDLVLIAAPGMGKTTTVFQVAEGIQETGNGAAVIVLLGEWATGNEALLASILKRPAFAGWSEANFRTVAASPGVVLLLDGWNELNGSARERARVQITQLKAELPELGLLITTRRQALDIPFAGSRISLLSLSNRQQMAIARAIRGEIGERLVDQAWRTAGVRELMSIPLYLMALLSLPEGTPFPTTKEEVLRCFVSAHERDAGHAATLQAVVAGFQQDYLNGLAVLATTNANTSIADADARRSVSTTMRKLIDDGQVMAVTGQPSALLDTFVSSHLLMRSGDAPGYAFQHQQFQEWYASHEVERLMLLAVTDPAVRIRLKSDILNHRYWTEAILFAIERAARQEADEQAACSGAILAAFDVDPILAAEMIFRATEAVWQPIANSISERVRGWHALGKVDRAVLFMMTSGRPDFFDVLWPLLTHPDQQVQLSALRVGSRFRPSVLGANAEERIKALTLEIRKSVLHEIASNSGIDGLDLATSIAAQDGNPEVKASVVSALWFRRADRHIADLLRDATDATFDLLVKRNYLDDVDDELVQRRLNKARARLKAATSSPSEQLRNLLRRRHKDSTDAEITKLVAESNVNQDGGNDRHLLAEVCEHYPLAVAEGLLCRVRDGRKLPYGADDLLAAAKLSLEDDALLAVVLETSDRQDGRAEAAASVLGPQSVGRLIDALLEARTRIRNSDGTFNQEASDRHSVLLTRINHTLGSSILAAVQAHADQASEAEIATLASLLSRGADETDDRARPFDDADRIGVGVLAQKWGERLLSSKTATRGQKAAIAILIRYSPSAHHLPMLKQLLDDNLIRYSAFRAGAAASSWQDQSAVREAQHPQTHEYQQAFNAIRSPETMALMSTYLTDKHFGELAAGVLASHWFEANEPRKERRLLGGVDFSSVEERRRTRAQKPRESSTEADTIFATVDELLAGEPEEGLKPLAIAIGFHGIRLPHGQRSTTIDRLVSIAPRESRARLLLAVVLSGEDINIGLVADGIKQTFEAAKKEPWILDNGNEYQLRDWLRLLPFASPLSKLPEIVRAIPDAQRTPRILEEMVRCFEEVSSADGEAALFKLAEDDPRFYRDRQWRSTALRLGTASSTRRLIDLTVKGELGAKGIDGWQWHRRLAELTAEHPEVRNYIRELLKDGPLTQQLYPIAHILAENPDIDELLMLTEIEAKAGRPLVTSASIENVVTAKMPSEDWQGAFSIVPVWATKLRQGLLALAAKGGPRHPATRHLIEIDEIRDRHGAPESEPRHPDLLSGKLWPLLTPDFDVSPSAE